MGIVIIFFLFIGNGFISTMILKRLEFPFNVSKPIEWKSYNAIVFLGGGISKSAENIVKPGLMAYSSFTNYKFFKYSTFFIS
jgi:hypothetical protein